MKRSTLNIVVDILAFASFVFLTTTGLVLEFQLPPRSGHSLAVLGLTRHEWGSIHLILAAAFFGILAIHLVLHWRWIAATVTGHSAGNSGLRFGLGIGGLIVLLTIAIIPWLSGTETISSPGRGHRGNPNMHDSPSFPDQPDLP